MLCAVCFVLLVVRGIDFAAADNQGLLPFRATAGQAEDACINVPSKAAAALSSSSSSTAEAAVVADSSQQPPAAPTAAEGSSSSSSDSVPAESSSGAESSSSSATESSSSSSSSSPADSSSSSWKPSWLRSLMGDSECPNKLLCSLHACCVLCHALSRCVVLYGSVPWSFCSCWSRRHAIKPTQHMQHKHVPFSDLSELL